MYLAHRAQDGREQTILEHNNHVAALCAAFAAPFGAGELGRLLGLAHDIGKYSDAFQRRIRGAPIQTDHSTAGAWECFQLHQSAAAFCVAGHHGSLPELGTQDDLPDRPTLYGRMNRAQQGQIKPYDPWRGEIALPKIPPRTPSDLQDDFFFIRMLYSCLVDADFLDTEEFMTDVGRDREKTDMATLDKRLHEYIQKHFFPPKGDLNRRRCAILERCLSQGEAQEPGLFTLTVPTGGGKTAASLAFALRHAKAHGLRRVVYVIPYTSIIEQTAEEFRKMIGPEVVLEHHSGVTYDPDEKDEVRPRDRQFQQATENWDMPVIVTTAVQFFESLYAARSSKCRKLHNLAESVIIFDEAQMLPLPYLRPCVAAIAQLIKGYRVTAVLCTATQPVLEPIFREFLPGRPAVELCPPALATDPIFQRVTFQKVGQRSWVRLAEELNGHKQVLCVVNSRKSAREVFDQLERKGRFHLSTLMYPAHRQAVLKEIRRLLQEGAPCRVVSTSLIEAGVDVDFPIVFREEAGLDSIVQAAGRCNREGKREAKDSIVTVFQAETPPPHRFGPAIGAAQAAMDFYDDFLQPEAIKRYFYEFLDLSGKQAQDKMNILRQIQSGGYPFRTTEQAFRLIDEDTCTVYIPLEEGVELVERLRRGEISRALLRKLGLYSVSVYRPHFQALYDANALELLPDGQSAILTDPKLYDRAAGLLTQIDKKILMV